MKDNSDMVRQITYVLFDFFKDSIEYNNNLDLKSQFPQQDLCYINLHKKEIKEIVNPPEFEREESNVKPYDPYNRYHPSL